MRLSVARIALLLIAVSCSLLGQENSVRVGVAVMENNAGRAVPGNVERDRLVAAVNQRKPDKKTHLKVQAIPLSGMTREDASEEAEHQNCQFVVYTTLTELRTQQDPYQHVPGTIESSPNSQWSPNQKLDPEFRATVEYKLVKVGSNNEISGAPFSTQQNGNEIDTVSQIMDRVASQVVDQIKKSAVPLRE